MASGCKHTIRLSYIALALICLSASVAHASYTVIDDDLMPTAVIEARKVSGTVQQYDVPFAKNLVILGPLGRRTIDQLAPSVRGATIKIIGRPDANPGARVTDGTNSTQMTLASARASALREYILRLGISASSITTTTDESPNPQANGSNYPSQIIVTSSAQRLLSSDAVSYPQNPPAIMPTSVMPTPAIPQTANNKNLIANSALPQPDRDQLIRFINQSVQSGTMDASVALTLISRLLNEQANKPSLSAPVSSPVLAIAPTPTPPQPIAQPTAPVLTPLFVATPSLARKSSWALDKTQTLRDNLNTWAKLAGWNPFQWDASNYFQVTTSTTLEGTFPDILRQIADSTGLNICARSAEKYVRVTDAGIPCKDR